MAKRRLSRKSLMNVAAAIAGLALLYWAWTAWSGPRIKTEPGLEGAMPRVGFGYARTPYGAPKSNLSSGRLALVPVSATLATPAAAPPDFLGLVCCL